MRVLKLLPKLTWLQTEAQNCAQNKQKKNYFSEYVAPKFIVSCSAELSERSLIRP